METLESPGLLAPWVGQSVKEIYCRSVCIRKVIRQMSQYPHLEYSMNDVRAAGIRLAGKVRFDPANYRNAVETFRVANS